ncbi:MULTISPECIES: FecCD family ABC transporter permease [Subtercola]|uniref:Iron ABC transporter permease n=1 Tax=Subtercola vilae TaxID=2056433 RepID=A0A4T2C7W9_9MICO|nr:MULTISPECIES: iron chelate uptake ABC transporter family permease subunit [Subtercola]MEA9984105.1 iron chelate uptake ABC transporter family permease subunit [Subtercola sp. RTI3]TIH38676.1 iron ABC transporter permease [Subtercola vilae]
MRAGEKGRGRRHAGGGAGGRRSGSGRGGRVGVVLGAVVIALVLVTLCLGAFSLSVPEVFGALTGHGSRSANFVVGEVRLPRASVGLLVGVCLGLSGALFQAIVRNPLASPDIIGITSSASATGISAILLLGLSGFALSGIVLAGALAAAAVIYLLAWRNGITGYRLVLVGIGVAAVSTSITSYQLTRGKITDVQQALVWLTGSLNNSTWSEVLVLAVAVVVLVPLTLALSPTLDALRLGDDSALALGVRVERSRLVLIVVAVALAAVAVSIVGPIGFVALVASPIARRLVGGGRLALVPAALLGGVIVLASDLVAQFALPGTSLPVGVVTGIVGAPYLLWLLTRTNRSGQGG